MKRQLKYLYAFPAILFSMFLLLTACENEDSVIGSVVAPGEVTINVDSITFDLQARPFQSDMFDSRSGNLLLGNLEVEGYGNLECSFVTRFMCTPKLEIPDSLFSPERVDSCRFTMLISNGNITGDSIAPQKVSVYRLTKALPSDINNLFDPEGYYNPQEELGNKSFILANISSTDSIHNKKSFVSINVPLSVDFGKEIIEKYKSDPEIFSWPQTMQEFLQGFFVKQTFGRGCVANVSEAYVSVYYHSLQEKTTVNGEDTITSIVHVRDSVMPFIVAPEVLSSNKVTYSVAQSIQQRIDEGETILTTPCGYSTSFVFPVEMLKERFESMNKHLSMVSDLTLSIPAENITNNYGIQPAPNLLMIKTSELDEFFAKNKVPDGLSSFTALYNEATSTYQFSSLRSYFVDLLNKDNIEEDDMDFTIIPVDLTYETVSGIYSSNTYVTRCVPYTSKPTVTKLLTDKALIIFSFTSQILE